MTLLKCKLLCHSAGTHVQQLYTGFKILADEGVIEVTQEICSIRNDDVNIPQYLRDALEAHLRVEVTDNSNHSRILYFDNHDSHEINEKTLEDCDLYFKRSFSSAYISKTHAGNAKKIHPLGLNYLVFPDGLDFLALRRSFALNASMANKMVGVLGAMDRQNFARFHPRLRHICSAPTLSPDPRVLFMVTAYDPHDRPDRPREKIEERVHNNEVRAECVRMLRKELGPRFYGGFIHNKFTIEKYRDVLIDQPVNAQKKNYLKMLEDFQICVATTGLHGSIGWKLAEYVAFSKAIVSERLSYEVPGQFCRNKNYLEFSTPQECVDQSIRLLNDDELRRQLMVNNSCYYGRYVRPDQLVLNALSTLSAPEYAPRVVAVAMR